MAPSTLCYQVAEISGQDYHTCVRYCSVAIAAILHSSQRWMTFSAGVRSLERLTEQREIQDRTVKGLNFFGSDEQTLLHAVQDPRGNIAGFRRGDLDGRSGHILAGAAVAALHRVLDIGVIKRVARTYRYYLTKVGRAGTATAA
jgi:hypothetical protein